MSTELALQLYAQAYKAYKQEGTDPNYSRLCNARTDCVMWLGWHGNNEARVRELMFAARQEVMR